MLGVSGRRGVSLSNRRVPGWYSSTSWIFVCFCLTFRNTHHDGVSVGGGEGAVNRVTVVPPILRSVAIVSNF